VEKIHNILFRQLKRLNLSESKPPKTIEDWQSFLNHIHRAYLDFDQNRLMNNRSQEIASREYQELYRNLEDAESIAHIGSWIIDLKTNVARGSAEADRIIGKDREASPSTFEEFLEIVYPADQDFCQKSIQNSIEQGINLEQEIRVKVADTIRWVRMQGRPVFNEKDHHIEKLQGTIIDITENRLEIKRKSMEERVLRVLAGTESLVTVIRNVLQTICETFNWKLGVFWLWDEEKQLLIRQEIWGENTEIINTYLESIPETTISPHSHFLIRKVWETSHPHWLGITKEKVAEYKELAKKLGIHTVYGFPVITHEKPISVLEMLDFYSVSDKKITDLTIESISLISKQLGLFLEKKRAQEHEERLNQELILTARRAGMAEVATSVLHNVGNILNSVNVSVNLLQEKLENSTLLAGFVKINRQLKEHVMDFNQYIMENPQGQQLPKYLNLLEEALTEERVNVAEEIKSLSKNVEHIKEVISTQQLLVTTVGYVESVSIATLIEDAIKIVGFNINYAIAYLYTYQENVSLNKVKTMQILVNLVRNAKDALMESTQEIKKLTFEIKQKDSNTIQVNITDNGVGIQPENMSRIFSFGFTTKKKGHGFGLHTSALLAKEMGGSIKAISEGQGKGATFILELPLKKESINE